jgi:NAD+ synthase
MTFLPILPGTLESDIARGSQWLRRALEASGQARFVLGLSGGLDSAVTALWACRAVGADRVTLVAMPYGLLAPSRFSPSTPDSLVDAEAVASLVPGAAFHALDIAPTVDAEAESTGLAGELEATPTDPMLRVCLGNIKARVRAVRLRYLGNRDAGLVLGTENRSEHWLGYFTLGGDEESALEVLSEYSKTEVRLLADCLGVPRSIRAKQPSADLWHGQSDEGELGFTYAMADQVLGAWDWTDPATEAPAETTALAMGVPPEVIRRVIAQVRRTDFKRAPKPVFPRASAPDVIDL